MSQPSTSSGHAVPATPKSHTITIPPDLKLPKMDLIKGNNREEYIKVGIPLYEAALKGDWKAAEPILKKRPELVRFAITGNKETLLHVAASAEQTKAVGEFVTNLVNLMVKEDLALQNKNGETALSLAAQSGNKETAMIMVAKNKGLIEIPNKDRLMPLYMAALFTNADMVSYLYDKSNKMSGDYWDNEKQGCVLQTCVEGEIFDVATQIVNDLPELLSTSQKNLLKGVLLALAMNTKAFEGKKPCFVFKIIESRPRGKESEALKLLNIIWGEVAKMSKNDIDDILRGPQAVLNKVNKGRVLFVAAKMGNIHFITEIIRLYPDAIWKTDDKGKTIFHLAIKRRQAKIYNLLYEIGAMKDLITPIKDVNGNNMLHMVAKSGKENRYQDLSGVVLQMQRELLWFKEVEKMIPPAYRQKKNNAGKTPKDLFTKKHARLVGKGENWMKNTASHCMVAATLIATIVFAAAFTLPGGYNQNTGIPFFRKEPSLISFVIADAISLICSSTSVLIFLSILTSRYAEDDFLASLPKKLIWGIGTLFLSIVTMMVAFSVSFFVLYNKKVKWVPITITSLAVLPVILFVKLQFRLVSDVYFSTYGSVFKPKKRILYY